MLTLATLKLVDQPEASLLPEVAHHTLVTLADALTTQDRVILPSDFVVDTQNRTFRFRMLCSISGFKQDILSLIEDLKSILGWDSHRPEIEDFINSLRSNCLYLNSCTKDNYKVLSLLRPTPCGLLKKLQPGVSLLNNSNKQCYTSKIVLYESSTPCQYFDEYLIAINSYLERVGLPSFEDLSDLRYSFFTRCEKNELKLEDSFYSLKGDSLWIPYMDLAKNSAAKFNSCDGRLLDVYDTDDGIYPLDLERYRKCEHEDTYYRAILPAIHLMVSGNKSFFPIAIAHKKELEILRKLQVIHAGIHDKRGLVGNNLPYYIEIPSVNCHPNYLAEADVLYHILQMSQNNMVVFELPDMLSLKSYLQDPRVENLLRLNASKVQYVFIFVGRPTEEFYLTIDTLIREAGLPPLHSYTAASSEYECTYTKRKKLQRYLDLSPVDAQKHLQQLKNTDMTVDQYIAFCMQNKSKDLVDSIRIQCEYLENKSKRTLEEYVELRTLKEYISLVVPSTSDPLQYSPFVDWLNLELLGMIPQHGYLNALTRVISVHQSTISQRYPLMCTSNFAIVGNKGTGKLSFAKLTANALHQAGIVEEDYVIVPASSFISEYQGQSSSKVARFYEENQGHAIIITDIQSLLHQCDYGQQVLDEIGIQMRNSRFLTTTILTGDKEEFQKILYLKPQIRNHIHNTIYLHDYSKAELYKMICIKLEQLGVGIDKGPIKKIDIENAIISLIDKKPEVLPSSNNLSFNMTSSCSLSSIVGNVPAVKELQGIIEHINDSDYILPKGILFYGSPGTGKTSLARCLAHDAGIPFCNVPSSYFNNFDGKGVERVERLFSEARKRRRCVIFIDEIEAIAPSRDCFSTPNPILTQLLQEMDGFEVNNGIIVIAATNHLNYIDSALLRAGRFDRKIYLDLPNKIERALMYKSFVDEAVSPTKEELKISLSEDAETALQEGLEIYMKAIAGVENNIDPNVNIGLLLENGHFAELFVKELFEQYCMRVQSKLLENPVHKEQSCLLTSDVPEEFYNKLAEDSVGASGALIRAIVTRAINFARASNNVLTSEHLYNAFLELTEGTESNIIPSQEELKRTAIHEAGHTLITILDPNTPDPKSSVRRVSIIPRNIDEGTALGLTTTALDEGCDTKASLIRRIRICLAGRVAEELAYGSENVSTGCIEDMKVASKLAKFVVKLGFNTEFGLLYLDDTASESTKAAAEVHANSLLQECLSEVHRLLSQNLSHLNTIADKLMEDQELTGQEIYNLIQ